MPTQTHNLFILFYYKIVLKVHIKKFLKIPSTIYTVISTITDVKSTKKLLIMHDLSLHSIYEQPRTRHKLGERSFSFAGPAAWNRLPPLLHELTNTVTFKKHLKTHLFTRAFGP